MVLWGKVPGGSASTPHSGQRAAVVELSIVGQSGISSFPWLSLGHEWQFLKPKGFLQRGLSGMGDLNLSSGLDMSLFCP